MLEARRCPAVPAVAIEAVGVCKSFGGVPVLDHVDLLVNAGEIHALVGANGAGKSTLLRILGTSIKLDSGEAKVAGADVSKDSDHARRNLGVVFGDERSFFWRLTGQQNLEFFASLRGIRGRSASRAAAAALSSVGLATAASKRVDRYSSGMKCRLGVARGLLGSPSVLLLDEPTKSLDQRSASEVRTLIRTLAVDRGVATLIATHDFDEAAELSSGCTVLRSGKSILFDPSILSSENVDELLIDPAVN
jgi:ABC-2 type transport system ATP-binding protein